MLHLYFFVSFETNDVVRQITVGTTSSKKAYALAHKYFTNHNAKGEPQLLAI